jgi:uncharacterized protein YacL
MSKNKKQATKVLWGFCLLAGLWVLYISRYLFKMDIQWGIPGALLAAVLVYIGISVVRGWLRKLSQGFNQGLDNLSLEGLMGSTGGLMVGVLVGAVCSYPLSSIGGREGAFVVLAVFGVCGFLGFKIGSRRGMEIMDYFPWRKREQEGSASLGKAKILDTSAIIDGRIFDVCLSNFLEGSLLVPTFVIEELQHIADSSDHIRRSKGRRGLELLSKMQKHPDIKVDIIEANPFEERDVDSKLIRLCKQLNAGIITNDYNLNKVAELQGLKVLNINELTNAVKVMVYPGETMHITIIKEGKEPGQGVGYLEDGTMVVVEDAYDEIGRDLEVTVTSVFQTAAGRMIFTRKVRVEAPSNLTAQVQSVPEVNVYG